MAIEYEYLKILNSLALGDEQTDSPVTRVENRTGIDTFKTTPCVLSHNMADGFPLLTTKRLPFKTIAVELEGFIKGITSKKWFQDRGCTIWDEWCNPQKVPYGTDAETQKKMREEDDLGPCIYGAAWRRFHDPKSTDYYCDWTTGETDYTTAWENPREVGPYGVDQLKHIVDTLKTRPTDRRMICMAWNPLGLDHTALPPCHMFFQVGTRGQYLDLTFYMRSWDFFLGAPFNIASYALLLEILSYSTGYVPGVLTAFGHDVHLYANHVDAAKTQLGRIERILPTWRLPTVEHHWRKDEDIFSWSHEDISLAGYDPHPAIKVSVAV